MLSDAKKRGPFKRMFFFLHPLQIVVDHHRNLCRRRNLSSNFSAQEGTLVVNSIITRPSFPGWHGGGELMMINCATLRWQMASEAKACVFTLRIFKDL